MAGVSQAMAWVRCTLLCGGRWGEMGVFQGTRELVGLWTWNPRAADTVASWVHVLRGLDGYGSSLACCAVWRGWLGVGENA